MPVIRIEGPADPRLAPYFNLRSGKHTSESFIVESSRLVERLLKSSYTTHSILATEKRLHQFESLVSEELPIYVGSKDELNQVAGFDLHRGCLAHACSPTTDITSHLKNGPGKMTVILEGLADPANVGAIIRNAAAFGASLVIADPKGASPFSRKAGRASAGQIFGMPIALAAPADAIAELRRRAPDIDIVATTGHRDALPIEELSAKPQRVLIIGNEGTGVSEKLRGLANSCRTITLSDNVDSLNAAAASALSLYILNHLCSDSD